MSDEEVRDEMFTMLVAGHETTATLMAWVIHRLLEHPDVLAASRAEVASVVGSGPHLPPPDAEQLGRLGYLDAVIKGDGAPPPGRAHRRAPARDGPYRRLRYAAGRLYYRAMHLPRSPPTRPVARAEFVRPPPVRGEAHGPLYVPPVRRWGAPLPGRSVRDLRDEDRVGPRVVTRDPATGSRLCRACRAAWSGAGPFFRPAGDTHGGLTAAGTFTGPCRPRTGASTGASAYCWKPAPPHEQHTRVDAVALRHHRDRIPRPAALGDNPSLLPLAPPPPRRICPTRIHPQVPRSIRPLQLCFACIPLRALRRLIRMRHPAAIGVEIVVGALCIAITASEHARARPSATDGRRPKCLTLGLAPQVRSTPPVFDAPRIRFDDGHVAIRTACEAPTPPCVPPNAVRFVFHGPPELPLVSLRRVRQDSGGPAFVCALQLS